MHTRAANKAKMELAVNKSLWNGCCGKAFGPREPVCVTSDESSLLQPASDPAAAVMSLAHDLLEPGCLTGPLPIVLSTASVGPDNRIRPAPLPPHRAAGASLD